MNTSVISEIRENTSIRNIADRVDTLDWERLLAELDAQGCAVIEKLITPDECDALAVLYQNGRALSEGRNFPQPRRDGSPRLRPGRI